MENEVNPMHLCECGCGKPAPIATRTRRTIGHIKGQPLKYINGHQGRGIGAERRARVAEELAALDVTGLCECGCGGKTALSATTNRKRGYVKGQPQRYIDGHAASRKPRKPCTAEGCEKTTTSTYCAKHATRLRRHGNLTGKRFSGPAEQRFWNYVDASGSCWIWTGSKTDAGYGTHWTDDKKLVGAHRYSYELHNGPIKDGLFVCHRCDNPPCVNPGHLFLGTAKDNAEDMVRKGRNRNGHKSGKGPAKCVQCAKFVRKGSQCPCHQADTEETR